MKTVLVGLSVLVASIGFAAGRASADTIKLTNLGTVSPTTDGVLLGPGVFLTGSNNAPQSTGADVSDPSGWDPWGSGDTTSRWLSVGGCCGGSGSFATFSFAATNVFTLLWGSPNSDNTITLYSGANGTGSSLATISFEDGSGYYVGPTLTTTPYGANTTGPGDIISIDSSELFQSAILTNDIGGFEVADISAVDPNGDLASPLPSTWTMLIAGFVGFGFFAYRGSKKPAAAIAAA